MSRRHKNWISHCVSFSNVSNCCGYFCCCCGNHTLLDIPGQVNLLSEWTFILHMCLLSSQTSFLHSMSNVFVKIPRNREKEGTYVCICGTHVISYSRVLLHVYLYHPCPLPSAGIAACIAWSTLSVMWWVPMETKVNRNKEHMCMCDSLYQVLTDASPHMGSFYIAKERV